jgi:hypothetical protein
MDEFSSGADGSLKGDGESRTAVEFGLGVYLNIEWKRDIAENTIRHRASLKEAQVGFADHNSKSRSLPARISPRAHDP